MKTFILDIQKMSTEDGPGIRTTVFLKGCSLKCSWCHNPESIDFSQNIYWLKNSCIGCATCTKVCPKKAVSLDEQGVHIDTALCDFCQSCVIHCPTNSIEIKGKEMSIEELIKEIVKDKAYYDSSGGGVTFSGGDPVLNWQFLIPAMARLKEIGIHIAIDTAGNYPYTYLESLLPYVDLILYDIKHIDSDTHKKYTDAKNDLILQNAINLGKLNYPKFWIRTPIIPDSTDSEQNIQGIGEFIKQNMPNIEKWELVSFNNLATQKYELLGKVWQYKGVNLITKDKMESLCNIAKNATNKAMWSGATKLEVTL